MEDSLFDPDPSETRSDQGRPRSWSGDTDVTAPLAVRMRPRAPAELLGQEHILGPSSVLGEALMAGKPHSAILYGPPGTGKTTLARLMSGDGEFAFEEESAVNAGRAEIRAVTERAKERLRNGRRTVLFLDEIHRFNKAQQDALLPAVEEGVLTLIGATTENPYFEVNSALISRCQVYELRPLTSDHLRSLLVLALSDRERGIPEPVPEITEEALAMIAERSGGDARTALTALERAAERAGQTGGEIDLVAAEDALQRAAIRFDRAGDAHYDYISAWIKATRGSDPDASIYYLAAMLEGGEDPRFIARRMVILASEDIGNADPRALVVANAAAQAVDRVGLPECALNLAQAVIYLSRAPKSNASYVALQEARAEIRAHGAATPPDFLRDAHYSGASDLGRGTDYEYPHDHPEGKTAQPLLPESLGGRTFFRPSGRGEEV